MAAFLEMLYGLFKLTVREDESKGISVTTNIHQEK